MVCVALNVVGSVSCWNNNLCDQQIIILSLTISKVLHGQHISRARFLLEKMTTIIGI